MFIIGGIIGAVLFVTLGYFAIWSALRQGTPPDVATFGRVISIVLFCLAAIVLIFSITARPFMGHMGHMMGRGFSPYPF